MLHGYKAVCHQFQKSGFCSYGTSCKFSHNGDFENQVYRRYGRRVSISKESEQFYFRLVAYFILLLL